jgi:hypothetical protein
MFFVNRAGELPIEGCMGSDASFMIRTP